MSGFTGAIDSHVVTRTNGYGLSKSRDRDGVLEYISGWVETEFGYVVVYAEPRGRRSKPFVSLRFISAGRCYSRGGYTRSDPSIRGLTTLAGRFAREITLGR